jgi:hypothetical protein
VNAAVTSMRGPSFEPTAWAWVDHIRQGGSTPWLSWASSHTAVPESTPRGPLPGAAQLEFVRRLAERRDRAPELDFARLADVVLDRSGPGRGLAQLPLLWPPSVAATSHVGAPPTDPERVPAEELIRVGVGALADLLQQTVPSRSARSRRRLLPRRLLWSRQFRLAGAPTTVASVRASLAAAGHAEGGPSPEVLLFVPPFDALMAQVWSARVQRGVPIRWGTFTGKWAARKDLPPAADIPGLAAYWRDRVEPEHVHVVVFEADEPARRTTAEILGLRTRDPVAPILDTLDTAGVDVVRRVNRLLNVRLPPARHQALVRRLTPLLAPPARDTGQPRLGVPERHAAWAQDSARRIASGLRDHGYAVHGDLDRITNRPVEARLGAATHPRRRDVLDLVLGACVSVAEQS